MTVISERASEHRNGEAMAEKEEKMSEQTNRIWKILFGIFLAAAVIGVIITCVQISGQKHAEAEMESLVESMAESLAASREQSEGTSASQTALAEYQDVLSEAPEDPISGSDIQALIDKGVPVPEKKIDFADLQENVNPDIYAWIYIPDTQIDYPVLQHATDNYYYLEYNLDGSKGYPGCIYTEDYNEKDFSDPNTVIYGHNMKNGTMFAGLHKFEDSEYFEEHPYVYIYTEDKLYVYEIFAAHESGNEHILYNNDFSDDYVFLKYLSEIVTGRTMNCNIREDYSPAATDRIITLSTCVANKPDRRYLVQGVLLNED